MVKGVTQMNFMKFEVSLPFKILCRRHFKNFFDPARQGRRENLDTGFCISLQSKTITI
jgi:hypothetical protein